MSLFTRLLPMVALALALALPAAAKPAKPIKPDHFVFVAYGDTRSQPDKHRAVIAEIVRMRPEFVLQSGDLVARGADPAEWTEFDAITRPLRDAHIAYYPARGNHDLRPVLHPLRPQAHHQRQRLLLRLHPAPLPLPDGGQL